MSLRLRINLVLTLVTVAFTTAIAIVIVNDMRSSVREEMESASRIAVQLIETVVRGVYAEPGPAERNDALLAFLRRVGRVRANDIRFYDHNGALLYQSPPSAYRPGRVAPEWFTRLVAPEIEASRLDLPGAAIVVTPDPSRSIVEAWDDLAGFAGLALAFLIAINLVILALVDRSLKPLPQILEGLAAMAHGRLHTRLPAFRPAEFASLSEGFNQMAQALEESLAQNRQLALVAQQSSDAIFIRDLDGRISFCNAAAERMLGFRPRRAGRWPGRAHRSRRSPRRARRDARVDRTAGDGRAARDATPDEERPAGGRGAVGRAACRADERPRDRRDLQHARHHRAPAHAGGRAGARAEPPVHRGRAGTAGGRAARHRARAARRARAGHHRHPVDRHRDRDPRRRLGTGYPRQCADHRVGGGARVRRRARHDPQAATERTRSSRAERDPARRRGELGAAAPGSALGARAVGRSGAPRRSGQHHGVPDRAGGADKRGAARRRDPRGDPGVARARRADRRRRRRPRRGRRPRARAGRCTGARALRAGRHARAGPGARRELRDLRRSRGKGSPCAQ